MKRVVITGFGILSSIGHNAIEVLHSLQSGKSGVRFSQDMKDSGMRSHVCGDIILKPDPININIKFLRLMNNATIYAHAVMQDAIKSAYLKSAIYENNPKVGIIMGSSIGSPRFQNQEINLMTRTKRLSLLSPYTIIRTMFSNLSACLGTMFRIQGVNYSISSACTSSTHCIGNAYELIQLGKQDIIFAGGAEELTWEVACGFDAMGALSRKYNDIPCKSSRAYDCDRDGFVIAEGAGVIVMEELEFALSRNAKIYAEIVSFAANSDGYNIVQPSSTGAMRCMKLALLNTQLNIDYLNTHAASTKIGDINELHAISKVFNKNNVPFISSTKSMTGHSLGASGVQEIIYILLMFQYNFIAPSINIKKIDALAKNMNIVTQTIDKNINVAMSNNFGFGGSNASIILKKYS